MKRAILPVGVLVAASAAYATELRTGDDVVFTASEPTTITETIAAPEGDDLAVTNYPSYCPPGEFVAFRNVQLSDIDSLSVLFAQQNAFTGWQALDSWACTDRTDGSRSFDFQILGSSLWGGFVTLKQSGTDIVATINPRWSWGTARPAQTKQWLESGGGGTAIQITNFYFKAINVSGSSAGDPGYYPSCWRNLSCKLKSGAVSKPRRFVFRNMSEDVPDADGETRTSVYPGVFTDKELVVIWKNTLLSRMKPETLRAKLGGSGVGRKWVDAWVGNLSTNTQGQLCWMFEKGDSPCYKMELAFVQVGPDVCAMITDCRYQYGVYEGYDFKTPGKLGAARTVANSVDGDHLAISGIACEWTVPAACDYDTTYSDFVGPEGVNAFRDVDLADVTGTKALMSGSELYGLDFEASVYDRTDFPEGGNGWAGVYHRKDFADGEIEWQYHYGRGAVDSPLVYSISLWFDDMGTEFLRVLPGSVVYEYGSSMSKDFKNGSPRTLATSKTGEHISIHELSLTRPWKAPLAVTVTDFAPRTVPVELKNVALDVAPGEGETVYLSGDVVGLGALVKAGAGTAVLSADVRPTGGLAVEAGVLEVAEGAQVTTTRSWMAPNPLSVGAAGTLRFVLGANGVTSLATEDMGVAQGATIALRSEGGTPFGKDWTELTLVSGANLTAADVAKLTLAAEGDLGVRFRMELFANAAGDLCLRGKEKPGLTIMLK